MNMVVNERRGDIFAEEELMSPSGNQASQGDVSMRSTGKQPTNSLFAARNSTKK